MKWWIMLLKESEICIPLYLYLILYDNACYYAPQNTKKIKFRYADIGFPTVV